MQPESIEVETTDHRTFELKLTGSTTRPESLKAGDYVEAEADEDDRGFFTARSITKLDKPPVKDDRRPEPARSQEVAPPDDTDTARPTATVEKSRGGTDPDDDGPPILKRGIPKRRPRPTPEPSAEQAAAGVVATEAVTTTPAPTVSDERLGLVNRARSSADTFLTSLPNYVAQQFTTRYASQGKPIDWKPQDVVSAEVVYEDGKERYEKLAINGRPVKGNIADSGAWTTGEFGTILADLFSGSTRADFRFAKDSITSGQEASIFDFEVPRERSHWHVGVGGQYTFPACRGSVWISKEGAKVLRIEMQARKLPEEFPADTVETAIDYAFVSLGGEKYLLPSKSESLVCFRGTPDCNRNVVEFRNYRKFTGESTIHFEK